MDSIVPSTLRAPCADQDHDRSAGYLPLSAVEAMLRRADHPDGRCSVIRRQRNRFSYSVFVDVEGAGSLHRYVVKLEHACVRQVPWDPRMEFEGLKELWEASQRSSVLRVSEPVAWGDSPPYLITTFIAGATCETLVKRGCRRVAMAQGRAHACNVCRRIGEWVGEKYHLTARSAGPYHIDEYASFCTARLNEIARFYGRSAADVVSAGHRWIATLLSGARFAELFPLASVHGQHHDSTPQNFIMGEDGHLWGIDCESYCLTHLDVDPCHFRRWLERMLNNPRYARDSLRRCWSSFAQTAIQCQQILLVSYVLTTLAHLAWCRNPQRATRRAEPLRTRVSDYLWARDRLMFLERAFRSSHDDGISKELLDSL